MKKILICCLLMFTSFYSFAQNNNDESETASPTFYMNISRQISSANINGKLYYNLEVYISSFRDRWIGVTPIVKIKVRSLETGKIIYRKKLHNNYLYVFRSGQIQIGQKYVDKVIIHKSSLPNKWNMTINEGGIVY